MQDSVRTPGRLTVMMPVITPTLTVRREAIQDPFRDELGRQLVHNIFVRKGMTYLMNKNGTRLKPTAQLIFAKGMQRLASNESPTNIVNDLEAQLKLIR